MKFKKTSVMGVVLSLVLVLAVTAAFASEPKEPEYDSVKVGTSVELVGQWPVNSKGKTYGESFGTYDAVCVSPDLIFVSAREETDWIDGYIPFSRFTHPSYPGIVNDTGEEFTKYLEWLETQPEVLTQPLYDCEENIIGEFRSPNPVKISSGEDQPTYQDISDYKMILPEVDENGVSRVYDDEGNLLVVGTPRTPFGTPLCDGSDCDIANPHMHYDGQVIYVDYQNPYTDPVPVPSVAPADDISAALHDTLRDQWEDRIHDQISEALLSRAGSTSCGVAECTETRYHAHNEGRTILLSDPCPVEGCTITGNHIHDDTVYSCNGAGHDGGVCDGSCYTYN